MLCAGFEYKIRLVVRQGRQLQGQGVCESTTESRMNNPAYTWIKSVNADNPINKVKSDKIRKCRLALFFSF